MRICLHTYYEISDPYIGGTQTLLIKLSKELKVLGHEPFIVCSSLNQHFIIEGIDIHGVIPEQYIDLLRTKYKGIPSSKFLKEAIFGNGETQDSLRRLADYSFEQYSKFQADIYHLNSYVAAYAQETGTPIVAYQHENEQEFDGFWGEGKFQQLIEFVKNKIALIQNRPCLFTASHHYANNFSKRFQIPIQSVHLGVLLNDMAYSREVTYTEETSFGRSASTIVILIPSRFNVKQKGQDLALYACEILLEKGYNVEVVFSGIKKSLYSELDEFRTNNRTKIIAQHLHFLSAYNMYTLYEAAHIVLSPERYCSYGLSISESLAIGIPTVLSDIPTYVEIASGCQHAMFFQKDNLEDLVSKLEYVIMTATECGYRYNESAIEFRINNDIRKTAIAFTRIYKSLHQ